MLCITIEWRTVLVALALGAALELVLGWAVGKLQLQLKRKAGLTREVLDREAKLESEIRRLDAEIKRTDTTETFVENSRFRRQQLAHTKELETLRSSIQVEWYMRTVFSFAVKSLDVLIEPLVVVGVMLALSWTRVSAEIVRVIGLEAVERDFAVLTRSMSTTDAMCEAAIAPSLQVRTTLPTLATWLLVRALALLNHRLVLGLAAAALARSALRSRRAKAD